MSRTVKEWRTDNHDAKIPAEVRLRIWNRAKGHCQICTRLILAGEPKHFDHITPLRDGGEHREGNLQIACVACHGVKTAGENSERAELKRKAKAVIGIKAAPKKPLRSAGFQPSQHKLKREKAAKLPMPSARPMFAPVDSSPTKGTSHV